MAFRIIHVVDSTTSADAAEVLALLLESQRGWGGAAQRPEVVGLGHRSTGAVLAGAGIPVEGGNGRPRVRWCSSLGWADPTSWRALGRLIDPAQPTLLHAWGIPAAFACAMAGRSAARIVTLTDLPRGVTRRMLAIIDQASWRASRGPRGRPVQWVGLHQHVVERLLTVGIDPARATSIPLAVAPAHAPAIERRAVREELGLLPQDGPVFLLAGDASRHSRHDYGLWAGGIVQQIFPRVRVIVREDLRRRRNHGLERLLDNLGDPHLPVLAPAEMAWESLLAAADALLVTADGPIPMGAVLHAMAAGVPVVGTPVPIVREVIEDRRTGLIAASLKPRDLAARIEELFSDDVLRRQLIAAAREETLSRRSPVGMVDAFRNLYAQGGVSAIA
jgi:hypothetical protein